MLSVPHLAPHREQSWTELASNPWSTHEHSNPHPQDSSAKDMKKSIHGKREREREEEKLLTEFVCNCSLNLSMVELERDISLNIPSSLLVN